MAAKIDIVALKIFKKSKTNETENGQKIKNSQSQQKFTGSKKEKCTLTCSLLKPKVTVNI